ncbi:MAG TPA: DUF4280 domain-containing protein [Candidatus Coprocola pullicola]|nr:DUF4280 domain-containing protein [Candidatus Coprocola pullicola]
MSKRIVCEGATLACSLGTKISELQIPDFHGVLSQGKNQANINDYKPNYNILSFCSCKRSIPPVPCVPSVVMKWLKGQQDGVLDCELALLEDCIVPCTFGGIIRIENCGQKE